jgi:hypothetical protein
MKRTLLALFLTPLFGAAPARAVEPGAPPWPAPMPASPPSPRSPPSPPSPPLPPLPPLPPMGHPGGSGRFMELPVKGPVTLRVDGVAIDIEAVAGSPKQVRAQLSDSSGGLRLVERGDRVDVVFESSSGWPHVPGGVDGQLRVELPMGSHVELSTASGDIVVHDIGGNVRVRSASGDLHVKRAASVEAMLISGDVKLMDVSGDVRLRTISGDAEVRQTGSASVLEFGTTSGDLDWSGGCTSNCRISARTTSGDVTLAMPQSSSWELRYVTHSGDLRDDFKSQVIDQRDNGSVHARYSKGEGCIEIQTFSGDLHISKR